MGDGDAAYDIFDLINPVRRTSSRADANRYRAEPYVMPADVRGAAPFEGQAGWTWYTGSAAWTWRLGVEAILGLQLQDGRLVISPCLPKGWDSYEAEVTGPTGKLIIRVTDPDRVGTGSVELAVDGKVSADATVEFPSDGAERQVAVRLRPWRKTEGK